MDKKTALALMPSDQLRRVSGVQPIAQASAVSLQVQRRRTEAEMRRWQRKTTTEAVV